MTWTNRLLALGLAASLFPMPDAIAADHRDGAAVKTDASTDINDVYTWMSADGAKVYLIMTVSPFADKAVAKFSNAAYYVFHTGSRANFTATQVTPVDVICGFDATQKISCWVGNSFVYGDATATAGISSTDGKVKVFAGPRKDHFFFNLDGFNNVVGTVVALTPAPTADANGCFVGTAAGGANPGGLTTGQTMAVRTQLQKALDKTSNAVDNFATANTLAIVVELDKTLLNAGGPILAVWGATHKK